MLKRKIEIKIYRDEILGENESTTRAENLDRERKNFLERN